MDVIGVIKEHPIPIGVGVLALIFIVRAGGSSTPASNNTGAALQSQSIASQTNVQLAGINATVVNSANASQSEIYKTSIAVGADLQKNNNTGLVSVFTSILNRESNMAALEAQRALGLAQINSVQTVALSNNSADFLKLQSTILGNQNLTNALIAADADKQASIFDYQTASLPSIMQHTENIANINATKEQNIAITNASATNKLVDSRTQTGTVNDWNTILKSLGGFVAANNGGTQQNGAFNSSNFGPMYSAQESLTGFLGTIGNLSKAAVGMTGGVQSFGGWLGGLLGSALSPSNDTQNTTSTPNTTGTTPNSFGGATESA